MKRFEVQVAFYVNADDEEAAFQQVDLWLMGNGNDTVINPDVKEVIDYEAATHEPSFLESLYDEPEGAGADDVLIMTEGPGMTQSEKQDCRDAGRYV